MQSTVLSQILEERKNSGDTGITFIEKNDLEDFLSYQELYERALNVLFFLQKEGVRSEDELVFQIDDNKTLIIVFWACILGGVIPVPLSVGYNEHKQKLFNVWAGLRNPYLIIALEKLNKLEAFAREKGLEGVFSHITNRIIDEGGIHESPGKGRIWQANENDIAFIQFSSGSTGNPKGVVLTHKNLITNTKAISKAAAYTQNDSTLSWMPLTHDMGLIGFHLNPLLSGMNQYLMPTDLFVRRPALWFDKATKHRISILCSPNFGYKYMLKHCDPAGGYTWDLSCVRILYNGAEPISEELCHSFCNSFSMYGLSSRSMRPVYGLAEASLAVSISRLDEEVESLRLDRSRMNLGDKITVAAQDVPAISFVNVGSPIDDCSVKITGLNNTPAEDEIIGHVQIKGDNVTTGYYNNVEATRNAIGADGWLDTGDLGFMKNGTLYITGRAKDIIFINGQNYYPHDIERVAEEVEGIELNKVAFAGFFNDYTAKEEVIAFVFHRANLEEFIPLAAALRKLINGKVGFEPHRVIPVKDIPKTTSGKLQRFKLLEQFRNGNFDETERLVNEFTAKAAYHTISADKPAGLEEEQLLALWAKVLGVDAVGVRQSFFEMGGNSLKAAELSMALQKEFGIELSLEVLYQKQTVRDLASVIGTLRKKQFTSIPASPPETYHPLSSTQKRLYYTWEIDRTATAYNMPVAFRIHGEVDLKRLETCINHLISRHDAMRTVFSLSAATSPRFQVLDQVDFALRCTACHTEQLDEQLRRLIQPFDLTQAPLFRAELLHTNSDEYIFFLDFHHIISDGISIRNFLDELSRLYAGHQLPVLGASYRDYVYWEKEYFLSPEMKAQEKYWQSRLGGELPILQLPLDFARPVAFSTEGAKMEIALTYEATVSLRQLAAANNCSLHALLFTLYNVLLWKYTGQKDLIVGIAVAGRRHPDLRLTQGMFVNNLAIRSTIKGSESFTGLLQQEKENLTAALDNQDYPFEHLIRAVGGQRDISRNSVFDSMFVYNNLEFPDVKNTDFTLSRYFLDPGFSKFDLSLEIFEEENGLKYSFEYATKLFRKETVNRMMKDFGNLISRIVADPDSKLFGLSGMTEDEYDVFVRKFNRTECTYPKDTVFHRLFEQQAYKTPDSIAVDDNGDTITFKQLNERANCLAVALIERRIVSNCIVGVFLPRSPALIVAILGVMKAGGAYLPIDTDLPEGRIQYLTADSRCTIVITDTIREPLLTDRQNSASGLSVINLDKLNLETEQPDPAGHFSMPGDLAYVIYTSGTTGRPKGVMIEHQSLINYTCWAADHYVKKEVLAFPFYTSVSFDLTITSIFTPLLTGNRIVIYGEDGTNLLLEQVIAENKVEVIKLTPSHLRLLREVKMPPTPSRVKRLIVGGEQLEARLARDIYNKFGGKIEIYNEYGPTEATVGCMIHKFEPEEDSMNVAIGIPAANTQIYLLNQCQEPVPIGVHGELYVSGDGIARGYLFQEELTSQKFVFDPFVAGQRMYKTGDIARQLPSGIIEYIGRADQQVKINGYRIELTEIEHELMSYPGIMEALVTLRANLKNQQKLCAYYRVHPEMAGTVDESSLRKHLAASLPHYMIPARFTAIERIPLNQNGKVDYVALPELDTKEETAGRGMPENEIESLLMKVWAEVLGEKKVQATDNFFELGGDSIKALQITSKLSEKGVSVQVKDILTYHTIAQVILQAKPINGPVAYQQDIVEGEKGLSPIERWFFGHDYENPHYYNQSVLLKLNKKLDVRMLGRAFDMLIKHHDGLRLNYNPSKGVIFYNNRHLEEELLVDQIILEPQTSVDKRQEAGPGDFHDLGAACTALKNSFDITKSRLLRVALIKEMGGIETVFITAHHLIIDGISWRVLLEDLYHIYNGLEQGEKIKLPRKTATLIDWEKALAWYEEDETIKSEAAYWQTIEDTPFALPQDFDTDDWRSQNLNKVVGTISREQTGFLLKEAHQTYKTDVPILLNTALALALRTWTGQSCFVIEQESHGRHLETIDVSRTIGWFTSIYPVKLHLKDEPIDHAIKVVKEQLKNVPRKGNGYGAYNYAGRSPNSKRILSQVRFNYLGHFGSELDNELFTFSHAPTGSDVDPNNQMNVKLELNAMVIREEMIVEINYNRKAHQEATILQFKDLFFNSLERILIHIAGETELHFTTSDFDSVKLTQEEIDALFM